MKWGTDGNADTNCSAGYNAVSTPHSTCVSATGSCYKCRTDVNIMKWSTDGDADTNCAEGYIQTETPQTSCVTSKACYVCKSDSGIMKWSNNGATDTSCPGGYTRTDKVQTDCPPNVPDNPKTGTTAIMLAWIVGLIALGYSIFYAIRMSKV